MTRATRWLLVVAGVLLAAGFLITTDNPTSDTDLMFIDDADEPEPYLRAPCDAPYDTVLNGADNYPGGGPWTNAEQIMAECRAAGRTRYRQGVGVMALGGVCVLAAGVVALSRRAAGRDRSRSSRP